MLIALASLRGSPGVTTAAMVMARVAQDIGWKATMVEADPDGSTIQHLFPGLDPELNLLEYAAASRRDNSGETLDAHAQLIDNDTEARFLIAPALGVEVARAVKVAHERIAEVAQDPERLVIVDCGRISNVSALLFEKAHRRFILARPEQHILLSLNKLYASQSEAAESVHTVLVGERPYSAAEVQRDLKMGVSGVIDDDRRAADMIFGSDFNARRFSKSNLYKSVENITPDPSEAPPAPMPAGESMPDVETNDSDAFTEWDSESNDALGDLEELEKTFENDEDMPDLPEDDEEPIIEESLYSENDAEPVSIDAGPEAETDDDGEEAFESYTPAAEDGETDDDLNKLFEAVEKDSPDPTPDWE